MNTYKVIVSLFIIISLTPHVLAIFFPYENWPVTSAPMFAHYVGSKTPRYIFRFVGEKGDGKAEVDIRSRDLKIREWSLMRFFFGKVYGSIDPASPFGFHPQETRDKFEERLSQFFNGLVKRLSETRPEDSAKLKTIRLEVSKLDAQNKPGETHVVGFFDKATGKFTHTWKSP